MLYLYIQEDWVLNLSCGSGPLCFDREPVPTSGKANRIYTVPVRTVKN
jgi:hypothetical protein